MNWWYLVGAVVVGGFCCRREQPVRVVEAKSPSLRWIVVSAPNDVKAVDTLPRFYAVFVGKDQPTDEEHEKFSKLQGIKSSIERKDGSKFWSVQFEADKLEQVMMLVGTTRIISHSKFCFGFGR